MKFIRFLSIAIFLSSCSFEKKLSTNSNSPNSVEVANFDNNKILSLCDIGNNLSKFDGKTVHLKSRISFGLENDTFSDEHCLYSAVASFVNEEAYQPIDKIRKENSRKKETLLYANVEVEGKFINRPFTRCCTKAPFQFEITKTHTAQPIKRD